MKFFIAALISASSVAPAFAVADKYNITPAEHAACDGDAERLCVAAFPDPDRLIACMKSNRDQLTPVCQSALVSGMRLRHLAM